MAISSHMRKQHIVVNNSDSESELKLSFFLQNEKPVTIIILLCRIFKKNIFIF